MTAMRVSLPAGAAPRRAGHFGAWRAVSTVPAMVGSLLLLLVLFGWLAQWEGVVLLCWIASGAAVFSRAGERVAVRVGAGFRRPTRAQAALLASVWATALARCGLAASEVCVGRKGDGDGLVRRTSAAERLAELDQRCRFREGVELVETAEPGTGRLLRTEVVVSEV